MDNTREVSTIGSVVNGATYKHSEKATGSFVPGFVDMVFPIVLTSSLPRNSRSDITLRKHRWLFVDRKIAFPPEKEATEIQDFFSEHVRSVQFFTLRLRSSCKVTCKVRPTKWRDPVGSCDADTTWIVWIPSRAEVDALPAEIDISDKTVECLSVCNLYPPFVGTPVRGGHHTRMVKN